jgi:hypothetical protein
MLVKLRVEEKIKIFKRRFIFNLKLNFLLLVYNTNSYFLEIVSVVTIGLFLDSTFHEFGMQAL